MGMEAGVQLPWGQDTASLRLLELLICFFLDILLETVKGNKPPLPRCSFEEE